MRAPHGHFFRLCRAFCWCAATSDVANAHLHLELAQVRIRM